MQMRRSIVLAWQVRLRGCSFLFVFFCFFGGGAQVLVGLLGGEVLSLVGVEGEEKEERRKRV